MAEDEDWLAAECDDLAWGWGDYLIVAMVLGAVILALTVLFGSWLL